MQSRPAPRASRGRLRPLSVLLPLLGAPGLWACASAGGAPPVTPPGSAAALAVPPVSRGFDATVWMQTAAEHRALLRQAYDAATRALPAALADSDWTAALEQTGDYRALPPAVIVDVDETVLDNGPFEARMLLRGGGFDPTAWRRWVADAAAAPLPGAREFLTAAHARGVEVFYVTNRDSALEADTRRNLRRAGLPWDSTRDVLLMEKERPGWGADKSSRRAFVARDFRILLLAGDDLNDFVDGLVPMERRRRLVDSHADWWGRRWIVLPNPVYGSWERALYDYRPGLSPAERRAAAAARLDTVGGLGRAD